MTTSAWRGDQAGYYQKVTIAATGTWATADTATLTINGKSITVTVGTAVATTDIVEILGRAVNGTAVKSDETRNITGDLIGEWSRITASYASSTLTLTADDAGVPFTVTASEVTAGSGALGAPSTTVAPAGPNELATGNVTGGLTAAGNTLVFEHSSASCLYGLDQSGAGTWTEVDISSTYTGAIGLPLIHSASPTNYYEYLGRYLQIRASTVIVGAGYGNGSGRILIDLGSVQSAVYVRTTASSTDTGLYAVKLKGTHASNTLSVDGGSVDVAPYAGEVATILTLIVSGSGKVRTSPGTTLGTVEAIGNADIIIDSATGLTDITSITIRDNAVVTVYGTNTITTVNIFGTGTFKPVGTFTVTNVNIGAGGIVNTTDSSGTVTFTNTTMAAKGQILDSGSHLVFTNAIDLGAAGLEDVTLRFGKNVNILPS